MNKYLRITIVLLFCFLATANASITVTTSISGSSQVNGYFNGTNTISIQVDLDDVTTTDLTTYGAGGIYLQLAWAESGSTPSSFNNMSSPTTVAFSSGTATISVSNSDLTATNATPDQDNFDLQVVIMDALPVPSTSTTEDITFPGSQAYITYDTDPPWLNTYSYPASNFNTQQVIYQPDETLNSSTSSTITFTGTAGPDNGTAHLYTMGTQNANELATGSNITLSLSGQLSNGDLVDGSTYSLNFSMYDVAGNNGSGTYTNRAYDTSLPTISDISTSSSDGTYKVGDDISYTVTFSVGRDGKWNGKY